MIALTAGATGGERQPARHLDVVLSVPERGWGGGQHHQKIYLKKKQHELGPKNTMYTQWTCRSMSRLHLPGPCRG